MRALFLYLASIFFMLVFSIATSYAQIVTVNKIDNVWSGHAVKPYLLVHGEHQFVAYYDANRQMSIAHRQGEAPWQFVKLQSWVGWDSHNYITMALDSTGHLHVAGNMHTDPLVYFRASTAFAIDSLVAVPKMVERRKERRVTYPTFLYNRDNQLIFKYRNGRSGNGKDIYNIYDTSKKKWRALHEQNFLNGQGKRSAYFEGPLLGPDNNFHLSWVWRNNQDARSTNSLSYATSPDLINWFDSNGRALKLPVTFSTTEFVDPIPPGQGLINGNVKLGFDSENRPLIAYHKFDENKQTQIYLAQLTKQGWQRAKISNWQNFRWDFAGKGTLNRVRVRIQSPEKTNNGEIGILVRRDNEVMRFVVDPSTLKTLRVEEATTYPPEIDIQLKQANRAIPKLEQLLFQTNVVEATQQKSSQHKYFLSWQSQPANRDRANNTITSPSALLLHEVKL